MTHLAFANTHCGLRRIAIRSYANWNVAHRHCRIGKIVLKERDGKPGF